MFITAQFIIAKTWSQPRCPRTAKLKQTKNKNKKPTMDYTSAKQNKKPNPVFCNKIDAN